MLTFTRSVQVDGGAPLELKLDIGRVTGTNFLLSALVLLGVALVALIQFGRKPDFA